jgi:hypothetical protein
MIPTGKCHQCDECRGLGCVGELPGMGGVYGNKIFQLNCAAWSVYAAGSGEMAEIRLAARGRELRRYSGEVWVDGGIRGLADAVVARRLGASEILIGRPLVSAFLREGEEGIVKAIDNRFRAREEVPK